MNASHKLSADAILKKYRAAVIVQSIDQIGDEAIVRRNTAPSARRTIPRQSMTTLPEIPEQKR